LFVQTSFGARVLSCLGNSHDFRDVHRSVIVALDGNRTVGRNRVMIQ